jgi:hypothetical protein
VRRALGPHERPPPSEEGPPQPRRRAVAGESDVTGSPFSQATKGQARAARDGDFAQAHEFSAARAAGAGR